MARLVKTRSKKRFLKARDRIFSHFRSYVSGSSHGDPQNQCLGSGSRLAEGDGFLKILRDASGFDGDEISLGGGEGFVGGLGEEAEPALEVLGIESEQKVLRHRVALVASAG